jgi:hypothetical protein
MKKFVILGIIFCLPLFFSLFVLEKIIRKIPNSYQYKNEWMTLHAKEVEVLILGSSTAYDGINPEYLPKKSFNAANSAQDFKRDYFLLKKYINNCPNLQYIILPVLPPASFFLNLESYPEGEERLVYYYIYMGYNEQDYKFEIFNSGGRKLIEYYLFKRDIKQCTQYGFRTSHSFNNRAINWNDWKIKINNYLQSNQNLANLSENIEILNKMIQLCEQNNVSFVLITTPAVSEFYNNVDSISMKMAYKAINEIKSLHPTIIYYDFLRDNRFEDTDFFNSNHLSNIGARKLTEILCDSLFAKN